MGPNIVLFLQYLSYLPSCFTESFLAHLKLPTF